MVQGGQVSQPGATEDSGSSRSEWRGKRKAKKEVVRHRWQRDWSNRPLRRDEGQEGMRRVRIGGLLASATGLLALFVYYLLFAEPRTSFIVVTATDYQRPFAPNAWAYEDLTSLLDEDDGLDGRTFTISDGSGAWRSKERGLRDLDRRLQEIAQQRVQPGTIIIGISMHGAVNEAGSPCLIPPGSLPLKSETWLPVEELLQRIQSQNLSDRTKTVLVLDCNRERVNWQYGMLYNAFADRLSDVVAAAEMPNLVVLNSCGPGQRSWASADLQGTAFGHFLRLGLAGEADRTAHAGNGDRRVSLRELHAYLQQHVDRWVVNNRGERQEPMLLPKNTADFELTESLSNGARKRLVEQAGSVAQATPAVPAAEITQLWSQYRRFRSLEPYRIDPLAWRDFQQKLLFLEQLSMAGSAYVDAATRLHSELRTTADAIDGRAESAAEDQSARATWNLLTPGQWPTLDELTVHSLKLAQYFGQIEPNVAKNELGAINRFADSPTDEQLTVALDELGNSGRQFSESHFLRMLGRYRSAPLWNQPAQVNRALATRNLAESVAAPLDERVHYWARPAVDSGDTTRRRAEDRLFSGDDASADGWTSAEREYQQARAYGKEVTRALAVHDLVWSELPYLAQWLCRPSYPGQSPSAGQRETIQKLLGLIDDAHTLGTAMADVPQPGSEEPASAPAFGDHAGRVQKQFEHFRTMLDDQYALMLQVDEKTQSILREIDALLAIPLLPRERPEIGLTSSEQRQKLRELRAQIAAELRGSFNADAGNGSEQSVAANGRSKDDEPADYLELVAANWDEHPALAILHETNSAGADDATDDATEETSDSNSTSSIDLVSIVARNSELVRDRLAGLSEHVKSLRVVQASSVKELRIAWDRAARAMRSAATLSTHSPEEDPILRLRQFDIQQLLLWNGRRSLDDFWGGANGDIQPFFEVAATDYFQGAGAVLAPTEAVRRQMDQLDELLGQRRQAAVAGLETAADNILLIDDSAEVAANVAVEDGPPRATVGLPAGIATVFIQDSKGWLEGAYQSLDLSGLTGNTTNPPSPSELEFLLDGATLSGRGPNLRAVTLFRGHEYAAPFLLNAAGGVYVDFSPTKSNTSRVTLSGRLRKRASMVFILDCSHSMSELIDVEVPGNGETTQMPRLEVAKRGLLAMLEPLAAQGDSRVGVRFYGHRVGWSTKQPNRLLQQVEYGREIPSDLEPWQDVESILTLGRFDPESASAVAELLPSVRPWGETPLYRALVEALQDFADEPEGTEKTIVLITDGVNYQFNADRPTGRQDVEAAWRSRQVPIQIVGFAIPRDQQEQAQQQFVGLAEATCGSYTPAAEATTLLRTLESLLGPTRYQVATSSGDRFGPAQLGTPVEIPLPAKRPIGGTVSVDALQEGIELSGGEALEFVIAPDGSSLETVPYEKGAPRFGALFDGERGSATGFRVGVHQPITRDGDVRFPFSIQHRNRRFSPRPAEVWIEVTPQLPEGQRGESRVFYDLPYANDTPVPVLDWTASDWPADARQAEVLLWCKRERTPPTRILRLADVANRTPSADEPSAIEGVSGVSYQVRTRTSPNPDDPFQVGIVERHGAESPGIYALKVELQSNVPAQRVVHQFDAANGLVKHTFYFDARRAREIEESATIQLTSQAALKQSAWQLATPIVVDVSDTGDVIRLSPPEPGG